MSRRPPHDLLATKRSDELTAQEFRRIEIGPPHGFGFRVVPRFRAVVVVEQIRGDRPRAIGLLSRTYASRRGVERPRDDVSRSPRRRRQK